MYVLSSLNFALDCILEAASRRLLRGGCFEEATYLEKAACLDEAASTRLLREGSLETSTPCMSLFTISFIFLPAFPVISFPYLSFRVLSFITFPSRSFL